MCPFCTICCNLSSCVSKFGYFKSDGQIGTVSLLECGRDQYHEQIVYQDEAVSFNIMNRQREFLLGILHHELNQ